MKTKKEVASFSALQCVELFLFSSSFAVSNIRDGMHRARLLQLFTCTRSWAYILRAVPPTGCHFFIDFLLRANIEVLYMRCATDFFLSEDNFPHFLPFYFVIDWTVCHREWAGGRNRKKIKIFFWTGDVAELFTLSPFKSQTCTQRSHHRLIPFLFRYVSTIHSNNNNEISLFNISTIFSFFIISIVLFLSFYALDFTELFSYNDIDQ